MKIGTVEIENYKSIKKLTINLDDFSVFVGKNGAGKSAIIRAIDWAINGGELSHDDIFSTGSEQVSGSVKIKIHFCDLTDKEKDKFRKYAVSGNLVIEREWDIQQEKSILRGRLPLVSSFENVLNESTISAKRKAYTELINNADYSNLPSLPSNCKKEEIQDAFDNWIQDNIDNPEVKWVFQESDPKFFGFAGNHQLASGINYVFLPAAQDLGTEFDSLNKQSVLNKIVSDFSKKSVEKSIESWMAKNHDALTELEEEVKESTSNFLKIRGKRIQQVLSSYLPNAEFNIHSELQNWKPKTEAIFTPTIKTGITERPVISEGHGVQRATLLALLQAIGEFDRPSEIEGVQIEKPNGDASPLILIIEEPELYQHPTQVKALARALENLASEGYAQVIVVSHSPNFVRPDALSGVKRVFMQQGQTSVLGFDNKLLTDEKIEKNLIKWLRPKIADAFFANAVLVVEGDTEQFVFENMVVDDRTLDDFAVHVIDAGGAKGITSIMKIMNSIGIPVFAVRDGDTGLGNRKNKRATKRATWKKDVEQFLQNLEALGMNGGFEDFQYGDHGKIGDYVAFLDDDLEYELAKWPSYLNQIHSRGYGNLLDGKQKFAGRYGQAARYSQASDCPVILKSTFHRMKELSEQNF